MPFWFGVEADIQNNSVLLSFTGVIYYYAGGIEMALLLNVCHVRQFINTYEGKSTEYHG